MASKEVCDLLESNGIKTEIIGIKSKGDKSLGGNLASSVGQFIHAVDSQLIEGNIDIAVHSVKTCQLILMNKFPIWHI